MTANRFSICSIKIRFFLLSKCNSLSVWWTMLEVPDNLVTFGRNTLESTVIKETETALCRRWAIQNRCSDWISLAAATMLQVLSVRFTFPWFSIICPENGQHMPQHSVALLFYSKSVQIISDSIIYQWSALWGPSSCHCSQKSNGPLWEWRALLAQACSSSVPYCLHTKCVFLTLFLSRLDYKRCLQMQFVWFLSIIFYYANWAAVSSYPVSKKHKSPSHLQASLFAEYHTPVI